MIHKDKLITIGAILMTTLGLLYVPTVATKYVALAESVPFALQDTKLSGPDPTPGHEQQHQVVTVLPQRNDSKIYIGTVTFASSRPVEIVVEHPFNLTRPSNDTASFIPEPLTVPGQNTAISVLHLGEGSQFDSLSFTGSGLAFHSRNPQNFTVSYSVGGDMIDATGLPK
jgi:hypothetical protein